MRPNHPMHTIPKDDALEHAFAEHHGGPDHGFTTRGMRTLYPHLADNDPRRRLATAHAAAKPDPQPETAADDDD